MCSHAEPVGGEDDPDPGPESARHLPLVRGGQEGAGEWKPSSSRCDRPLFPQVAMCAAIPQYRSESFRRTITTPVMSVAAVRHISFCLQWMVLQWMLCQKKDQMALL